MGGIGAWITTILGVVIIGVVADLLLSNNRMHKFVRGIFGVVTLFVIAAPLPGLIRNGFEWDFDWGGGIDIDQDFLDNMHASKIRVLERATNEVLRRSNIIDADITIRATISGLVVDIQSVIVNLVGATVPSEITHDTVVGLVANALSIERSIIVVVG